VGLAWLASGARPGTRLVSVEIDTERAGLVAPLFADLPHVAVRPGDWREIYRAAPFDLLVLDGGGYPPSSGWPPTWPPSSPPAASLLANRAG
jgi:hypothetical protein